MKWNVRFFSVISIAVLGFNAVAQKPCYQIAPIIITYTNALAPILQSIDFDNDGFLDVGYSKGNNVAIRLGNGTGNFAAEVTYTQTAIQLTDIKFADVNGDGKSDAVLSDYANKKIGIMFNQSGNFNSPVVYNLAQKPFKLTLSDFNGDGINDIAAISDSTNITMLLSSGTGTFAVNNYSVGLAMSTIQSGDFNNDAKPDIAFTSTTSVNFGLVVNNGSGSFSGVLTHTLNSAPQSITTADYNNDGNKDVAIGNSNSELLIFNGNGLGNFSLTTTHQFPWNVLNSVSEDFDNNGLMDIAVGQEGVSVMLNLGGGNFKTDSYCGATPWPGIVSGDFSNDGKKDILALNNNLNGPSSVYSVITALINNGNGTFSAARAYNMLKSSYAIANSDVNNDGFIDLLVVNSDSTLSVFMGNLSGIFSNAIDYTIGMTATSMCLGDFNNDGTMDVATTSGISNRYVIMLNQGSGTFVQVSTAGIYSPGDIVSKDFNNDGKMDLAICRLGDNIIGGTEVSILLGNGNGTFGSPSNFTVCSYPRSIASADFNSDGNADIVVCSHYNKVTVLLGLGNGSFSPKVDYTTINLPECITVNDFNGDGKPDIAVAGDTQNNQVAVMINSGTGSFSLTYYLLPESTSLVSADVNGDGKIDLISNNNTSISNRPAASDDINVVMGNGSGAFSSSIVSYNNGSASTGPLTTGDFNSDGRPDFASINYSFIGVILSASASTISVSGPGTTCANAPVVITANGAAMYSWSNNTFSPAATVSPSVMTTYTVTGTNSAGCSSTAVKTISITPGPTVTINPYYSLSCPGKSITLTAQGADGYSWTTGETTSTLVVAPMVNTTYSVIGTSTSSICTPTVTSQVVIAALPVIGVTGASVVCYPTFTNLQAYGANTYTWSNGSTYAGTSVNVNATSTYTVIGAGGAGNCTNTAVYTVSLVTVSPPTVSITNTTVCRGTTVNITASGANSYYWNTGATTASVNVTPTVTTVYNVSGYDVNNCYKTSTVQVVVLPGPAVTVNNGSVCIGSSYTINPGGANSYTFSSGSNIVTPLATTVYSVTGEGANNCTTTQTVNVTVNNNCQDVWPGDANSDGTADNLDVLELGLHYTQTGPARASTSNSWQSYFANNWTGTIANGKNVNHSDCNGDGTIDNNDTLAIYNNYGLTHAFKSAQTNMVNPQLSIVPDQSMVVKGTWGSASIYLGDATDVMNNINGIAFTVDFDHTLIEPNSIYIEYQTSFLDASQNLYFRKLDFSNDKIYTATTHTISNNVSGYGKIATLHYQVLSGLTTDQVLNIGLSQANQSDDSGIITPVTTGTGTLMAIGASVGMQENAMGEPVFISPNPAHDVLKVSFIKLLPNTRIELYNSIGALVFAEQATEKTHTIPTAGLSSGLYFIKVVENNKVVIVRKIVKQ